jgi:DNA-binding NtrC family response regulator
MTNRYEPNGQRALIVERDHNMRPLVASAIQSAIPGVCVDWVDSKDDALLKIKNHSYSVIVADIYLKPSRGSGLDLWRSCQKSHPEIPMLLTSSIPIDDFSKKMGLFGPHHLSQPFTLGQCKEVIKNLVSFDCLTS